MEQLITEALAKQGILGALLVFFIYMFRQFIVKLFEIVNNNTAALSQNTATMNEVKEVIQGCKK